MGGAGRQRLAWSTAAHGCRGRDPRWSRRWSPRSSPPRPGWTGSSRPPTATRPTWSARSWPCGRPGRPTPATSASCTPADRWPAGAAAGRGRHPRAGRGRRGGRRGAGPGPARPVRGRAGHRDRARPGQRAGSDPGRDPGPAPAPDRTAAAAVRTALGQVGRPYRWGATGPATFDCSGLTRFAYAHAGLTLPRTSRQQWSAGRHVRVDGLRPGDLVFFAHDPADPATIHHVGMYVGQGLMVHAPHRGAGPGRRRAPVRLRRGDPPAPRPGRQIGVTGGMSRDLPQSRQRW